MNFKNIDLNMIDEENDEDLFEEVGSFLDFIDEENFQSLFTTNVKFLSNLTFWMPFDKNDEVILMNNRKSIPLFLNDGQKEDFMKKYGFSEISLKPTRLGNIIELDCDYYLINPLTDSIFLNKTKIDASFCLSEIVNASDSLENKLFDVTLKDFSEEWEIKFDSSLFNISMSHEENFEKFLEENPMVLYYSPFIHLENDFEYYCYEKDGKKLIPIFSNLDCYLNWENNSRLDLDNFNNLLIESLNNMVSTVDFDENDIIINPGINDFIITEKEYGSLELLNDEFQSEINKVESGYDIKVRLKDFKPNTWRDLIIPSNITFHQLHEIIQIVMGMDGYHLYEFYIPKPGLTISSSVSDNEFSLPEIFNSNESFINDLGSLFMDEEDLDSEEILIESFFDTNKKITYCYDFGDGWEFTIQIKKKVDYDKPYATFKRYKGEYNPVEDCGGVWGLERLIEENSPELDKFDSEDVEIQLKSWKMN